MPPRPKSVLALWLYLFGVPFFSAVAPLMGWICFLGGMMWLKSCHGCLGDYHYAGVPEHYVLPAIFAYGNFAAK